MHSSRSDRGPGADWSTRREDGSHPTRHKRPAREVNDDDEDARRAWRNHYVAGRLHRHGVMYELNSKNRQMFLDQFKLLIRAGAGGNRPSIANQRAGKNSKAMMHWFDSIYESAAKSKCDAPTLAMRSLLLGFGDLNLHDRWAHKENILNLLCEALAIVCEEDQAANDSDDEYTGGWRADSGSLM